MKLICLLLSLKLFAITEPVIIDNVDGTSTIEYLQNRDKSLRSVTDHKTIVMIVNLANVKNANTPASMDSSLNTGARNVKDMYKSASYGQVNFSFDIIGPFTIAQKGGHCNTDYTTYADQADATAIAAGYNLNGYQHRLYILPSYAAIGCSWIGIGNLGCYGSYCRAWVSQAQYGAVTSHELGHNLGMMHASRDTDNNGTNDSEYGDWSDMMGNDYSWRTFNAAHKIQMNWFAPYPTHVQEVTANGIYTLYPLEKDPSTFNGLQVIKIKKKDTGEWYFLSYRDHTGYDLNLSSSYANKLNITRHLYGWQNTMFIKALDSSIHFIDSKNNIIVQNLGISNSVLNLSVQFGS